MSVFVDLNAVQLHGRNLRKEGLHLHFAAKVNQLLLQIGLGLIASALLERKTLTFHEVEQIYYKPVEIL